MSAPSCDSCRYLLAAGKPDRQGRRFFVPACTNPKVVRNRVGIYAVSLARRYDERCGPDAVAFVRS